MTAHRDELTELYAAIVRDRNEMNPPRSFQHQDDNSSIKSAAIGWLRDQGASTVLLFLILLAIGWGGHFAMTIAIPAHLQQIQDGYKETEKVHQENEKLQRDAHRETIERILEAQERRHDRAASVDN